MHSAKPGTLPDDPDFDIRLDRHGDVVLLSLTGRLDAVACLILKQYVVNALVGRIPPLLVMDLTRLTAIDECGCDLLSSASQHARAADGRLLVVDGGVLPGHAVHDIELFTSVEAALVELTGFRR
ncbi:anti-anti-sigma factor [Nonomuraea thailandensis]|uniref:Anti-anti-sigma factor n=1 Tax=Nonomuraea thailandensis TaxID=1188745 RepID=A0A9X2GJQ5_9ACTN|nr:STAS domain-containing protein [Nonomuraea thailandensis]MCP2356701.1 anti-anti-sigma factor [Nonomuraea thailandensis]